MGYETHARSVDVPVKVTRDVDVFKRLLQRLLKTYQTRLSPWFVYELVVYWAVFDEALSTLY